MQSVLCIYTYCSSVDVQYIFLVGGLSESPLFQQATREKFGAKAQVLVPQEASLAVLKGTVCTLRIAMTLLFAYSVAENFKETMYRSRYG